MSFLKISDPLKRDSIVKEYLELKKKIRDNFLSERIGEQQLQTDFSKFYKPITETQKATVREITEGLKPIREGIDNIPDIILGRDAIKELKEEEEEVEEEDESVGEMAEYYLKVPSYSRDKKIGICKEGIHHYIGNKHVVLKDNDITIKETGERFEGTPGLWKLIMFKNPKGYTDEDYNNFEYLMMKTDAIHVDNDPNNRRAKGNYKGYKWKYILSPIWEMIKKKKGYEGKGVVVIPSDPNALLERLDLLLASQEAGHTGVRNELVSICDELKRQDVLDTKAYKKLNHLIKK